MNRDEFRDILTSVDNIVEHLPSRDVAHSELKSRYEISCGRMAILEKFIIAATPERLSSISWESFQVFWRKNVEPSPDIYNVGGGAATALRGPDVPILDFNFFPTLLGFEIIQSLSHHYRTVDFGRPEDAPQEGNS